MLAEIEKNEEALSEQRSGLDKAEDKRKEIADRIQRNNMDILTVNGDISNIRTRIEGIDASILALSDGGSEQLRKIGNLKTALNRRMKS